jgi:hypothetical protein
MVSTPNDNAKDNSDPGPCLGCRTPPDRVGHRRHSRCRLVLPSPISGNAQLIGHGRSIPETVAGTARDVGSSHRYRAPVLTIACKFGLGRETSREKTRLTWDFEWGEGTRTLEPLDCQSYLSVWEGFAKGRYIRSNRGLLSGAVQLGSAESIPVAYIIAYI